MVSNRKIGGGLGGDYMQGTTPLKKPSKIDTNPLGIPNALEGKQLKLSPQSSMSKGFRGACQHRVTAPCSKKDFPSIGPQKTSQRQKLSLDEDLTKSKICLSTIKDPLWKYVCCDVISMMGAASFLKIWDSTLGEVCSQDQSMEIHCQTEETAQFIQQYAFVILGSLKPYFPALKQLRIKTVSNL